MPPTGPFGDMPRVAVVFAKLVVDSEHRGVRPFIVVLGDGKQMSKGVTARYVAFKFFRFLFSSSMLYIKHLAKPRWCQAH